MTTVHDPERKRALVLRLKRVEGQLRGIQKLIETDADCEKVAQQLAAARKALDKSFFAMVGCVIAQGDVPPTKWPTCSRAFPEWPERSFP
jgi:CsoR family transcriptional regulator, copper-sensing transcriptional repressor